MGCTTIHVRKNASALFFSRDGEDQTVHPSSRILQGGWEDQADHPAQAVEAEDRETTRHRPRSRRNFYFSGDMARQRNIHSEEHLKRLQKSQAKATGFYKKGGKTRPITKKKPKKTRVVKKVVSRSKGRYFYEYEDHVYETQKQARNVLEIICPPGKHQWTELSPDSKVCSTCGLIQVDRKAMKKAQDFDQQIKDHLVEAYQTYLSDCEYLGYNPVSYDEFKQKRGLVWGRHRKKKPEAFGWKQDGMLWTKGAQHLEVWFDPKTGSFEVLWGNDDTGDLDVLDTFDGQIEAIKYAENWITVKELDGGI